MTPAIANLIREGKTFRINSAIQTGKRYGMQLLDDALFNLWDNGICEEKDVIQKSNMPGELRAKIEAAKKGILEDEGHDDDDDEYEYE